MRVLVETRGQEVVLDCKDCGEAEFMAACIVMLNAGARKSQLGFDTFIDVVAEKARSAVPLNYHGELGGNVATRRANS